MAARTQLAAELRRLRELAGLSGRQMAVATGISQTTLVRTEQAERLPSLPQIRAWAEVAGAGKERITMLTELAEAAYTEVETWRDAIGGATHLGERASSMDAARLVQQYQPTIVPGLLQTADYARRVLKLSDLPNHDVAAAVTARLDRQSVLFEQDRRTEFLLTEGALRQPLGPRKMMLAQLDRIRSVCSVDEVRLGIIPQEGEVTALGWHGFAIYDRLPKGEPFVYIELQHAQMSVTESVDVAAYRRWFKKLGQTAVFGDAAAELLNRLYETTSR